MKTNQEWVEALRASSTFHQYRKAFSEAVDLPLSLQAIDSWSPALRGTARENEFCKFMASQNKTCASCLCLQEKLCHDATTGPQMRECQFGLTEIAVPISVGDRTIGFLRSGQVFSRPVTEKAADRVCEQLQASGQKYDLSMVRRLYLQTRVRTRRQISSIAKLLSFFAEHISMKSNLLALRESTQEPVQVSRVREFVQKHHADDITLLDAARVAHTSTFYLCKLLKRHLGVSFTELVSRERVERAKSLLAEPNLRISEVAYEVGFQSLTHFNRTFKKLTGQSPTDFREAAACGLSA